MYPSLFFSYKRENNNTDNFATKGHDLLPSWNNGTPKKAIIDFVERTIKKDSKDYVPFEERIACFDNDETLWAEQPMYFRLALAIDRIKAMPPQHPEWDSPWLNC